MGKVIKETLATEDNDPMELLGTWGVFTPKKFSSKEKDKKKPKDEKVNKKNKVKK
jgi:hypothetical protein